MTTTYEPDGASIDSALANLATFVDGDHPGWTRAVLSDPYKASRDFISRLMTDAGLEVIRDGGGNIVGRLPGRAAAAGSTLKPLVTGSHTDTVRGGGRFDGAVGVVGAIAAATTLRDAGVQLDRDLYIVDFLG